MTAPADQKTGIALIGCGSIGDVHLRGLREIEGAVLVGVFSRTLERAREVGAREGCRFTTDHRELLRDPAVAAVSITTSSGTHATLALEALDAGKHVLVEKPMALELSDARRMIERARRNRVVLSVVSQRRFEEGLGATRRALASGALGRLLLVEATCLYHRTQEYYDSADWRGTVAGDGGVVMNQAIHSIDLMLWLAGPARSVIGRVTTQTHRIEAEDLGVGVVTFASGAIGTIVASTSAEPGRPARLALYGEKGTIRLEANAVTEWNVPGTPAPVLDGIATSMSGHDPKVANHRYHTLQMRDFLRAVENGGAPAVTGEDGLRALEVVKALYSSSAEGRAIEIR